MAKLGKKKKKKPVSLGGKIKSTFRGVVNYFRNFGSKLRTGKNRRPKGTSGRSGGVTSKRMAKAGNGGR